jgi:hypothetical protein
VCKVFNSYVPWKCEIIQNPPILLCFLLFQVLTTNYQTVVTSEEFDILRSLLMTEFPHKLKLAADFLTYSSLSPAEVMLLFS